MTADAPNKPFDQDMVAEQVYQPAGEVVSMAAGAEYKFDFPSSAETLMIIQTVDANQGERAIYKEQNESGKEAGDQLALVDLRGAPTDGEGFKYYKGMRLRPQMEYIILGQNFDQKKNVGYKALRRGETFTIGSNPGDELDPKSINQRRFEYSELTSSKQLSISVNEDGGISLVDLESEHGSRLFVGSRMGEAIEDPVQQATSEQISQELAPEIVSAVEEATMIDEVPGATVEPEPGSAEPQQLITEVPTTVETPETEAAEPAQLISEVPATEPVNVSPEVPEVPEVQPSSIEANETHALMVEDDELVRESGNGGKPINETYRQNNERVRQYLLDRLKDGSLYEDPQMFTEVLQFAHRLAAGGDVYSKVGEGSMGLGPNDLGVFRDTGMTSKREGQSRRLTEGLAREYQDSYQTRFANGPPDMFTRRRVPLEGIDEVNQPDDVVFFDESGVPEKYEYNYPRAAAMPQYAEAITRKGQQIAEQLSSPEPDKDVALRLIAEQYQYGAIMRPFVQINNSLFMNLANMQIKSLGFNGITHAEMDIAAQRMQPENFAKYFVDRVKGAKK